MDISILRSATIPQLIMDFVEIVDIGIMRSATLPQVIAEVVDVGQV